jgi:aspartate/methionine/tyrosine aminotransferase
MRKTVSNPKLPLLKYGIREIIDVAQRLKEIDPGFHFIGENIGDPVAKGWPVPAFLKQIMIEEIRNEEDTAFAYTHSRGNPQTRKWVVDYAKRFSPSSNLDYEYVLFTNGLGAAIASMYHMLPFGTRILQPTPTYPSHASMEAFAAGQDPLLYRLDPTNEWQPDLNHMESQIKTHPEIAGVLVINPNNPTGAVYSKETVEQIVKLAEKYNLMIISDEVYFRMVYNGHTHVQITELAHNRVPLMVMRGLSKDVPWPGSRCGWVEFHNIHLDQDYKNYCEGLKKRVLMEVCGTTLPQLILPRFYDHPDFPEWNRQYNSELEKNGNYIAQVLGHTPGLKVNRTNGAFYMMPLFEEGVLNERQTLPIKNSATRAYIEQEVAASDMPLDKRFAYYLLAATGICVVPATGFYSPFFGFRLTTLDRNEKRRKETYATLSEAVRTYLR